MKINMKLLLKLLLLLIDVNISTAYKNGNLRAGSIIDAVFPVDESVPLILSHFNYTKEKLSPDFDMPSVSVEWMAAVIVLALMNIVLIFIICIISYKWYCERKEMKVLLTEGTEI